MKHEIRRTAEKIAQRIELIAPLVHRESAPLPPFRYQQLAGPDETPSLAPSEAAQGETIHPPAYWGEPLADFVLRGAFEIPAEWEAGRPAALYLPIGETNDFSHPEALVYVDGDPLAACDRHHQEIRLPDRYRDGASHTLTLHGWMGWLLARPGERVLMQPCAVVQIDLPTRAFIATARVALGVAEQLAARDPARAQLLTALDEAFQALDTREPFGARFYASVPAVHEVLRDGIVAAGPALGVDLVATGHAHIDVAWLWPLAQTRRKTRRTFYNVLRLMEQFPDNHFSQSQAQLYAFVQEDDPALFAAVQQRAAEGRWEPIGGTWVEMDCNITGAESLARQFTLGQAFFREHFGAEAMAPVLWLPDVFGYAASLPQLIRQAGLRYFFTTKLSWNQYNRLPHESFWWQGIDGTRVLTHFGMAKENESPGFFSTYNSPARPTDVIGTWTNAAQKELSAAPWLMTFGYGDGGGGPTREMLENLREMKNFPATPRVHQLGAGDFFRTLEAQVGDRLPVWDGELYLEIHRGTYTTQGRTKRANRKSEFALHDAEFLAAWAARLTTQLDESYQYPTARLRAAWQLVCLNQFHDIIPGSSIGPVYEEALAQYAEVQATAGDIRAEALAVLAEATGGDLLLINPTSFARRDLAFWDGELSADQHLARPDGTPVPTQATVGGVWIAAGELPPYSVTPLMITMVEGAPPEASSPLTASATHLENAKVRVEFNAEGDITRIYDKINAREVLAPGAAANQFQAFEDRPLNWDAWDVDIFFEEQMWLADPATDIAVIEAGPLRATLEIRRRILHSEYVQRISLTHNSPRIDFETTIDWRERHILLKAAFPVEILSPVATYEIQWGNVQRPTHRNTSWDWARFEVCAQKWIDLSEGDYGVSLLNDCKYGHDVHGNVMRLSLLRSPTEPDPEADQGEHHFTYSLLPHAGSWDETTIGAAYALNDPIITYTNPRPSGIRHASSVIRSNRPNLVIETVKQAEDGRGLIVRLYESQRQRGRATLMCDFSVAAAWRTNLLEENEQPLAPDGQRVAFDFAPYEIITLRLIPEK